MERIEMERKNLLKCLNRKMKKLVTKKDKSHYDCSFKIVLLGSNGVGKTSLMEKVRSTMNVKSCSFANDCKLEIIMCCDSATITLELTDLSEQVDFAVKRRRSILEADGFILLFSSAEQESLKYLVNLRKNIQAITGKDLKDLPVVVVGNKCDLSHETSMDDIVTKQCFNEMDSPVVECSVKEDLNIPSIFQVLCDELGIYGAIYEKVLEIQCREELVKAERKSSKMKLKGL